MHLHYSTEGNWVVYGTGHQKVGGGWAAVKCDPATPLDECTGLWQGQIQMKWTDLPLVQVSKIGEPVRHTCHAFQRSHHQDF